MGCCVFRPVNGSFAGCQLVQITFYSVLAPKALKILKGTKSSRKPQKLKSLNLGRWLILLPPPSSVDAHAHRNYNTSKVKLQIKATKTVKFLNLNLTKGPAHFTSICNLQFWIIDFMNFKLLLMCWALYNSRFKVSLDLKISVKFPKSKSNYTF